MNGLFFTSEGKTPAAGSYRALPSFRLSLLASLSVRQTELRLEERFELRMQEARVIGAVGTFGALSLKDICHEAHIEKSYASKLIARLHERGLVEKLGDSVDQRAISVHLTPLGRELHRTLYAHLLERNDQWLSVLEEAERGAFLRSLEKLIDHTRDMLGQSAPASPEAPADGSVPSPVTMDLQMARQLHHALGALIDSASSAEGTGA